jgi:hypothetical protein
MPQEYLQVQGLLRTSGGKSLNSRMGVTTMPRMAGGRQPMNQVVHASGTAAPAEHMKSNMPTQCHVEDKFVGYAAHMGSSYVCPAVTSIACITAEAAACHVQSTIPDSYLTTSYF